MDDKNKLYLINDGKTIVTRFGAITPFHQSKKYEDTLKIPEKFLEDPESLRQLIGFKLFEDRTKIINKNDFYMRDPQVYKKGKQTTLISFLQAAHKVMRLHYENYRVEIFSKYVVVLNCPTIKFTGTQVKETCHIDSKTANGERKPLLISACYKVEDDDERTKIFDLLTLKYAPAIIDVYITTLRLEAAGTKLYQYYKVPTSTKVREIWAPEDSLKDSMRHLLLPLTSAYDMKKKNSTQYAYIKERSIVNNAEVHKDNKYIAKFDIKGFFDFCNWDLSWKYLKFLFPKDKYGKKAELYDDVKNTLKRVIINEQTGGLFQGNPVSGVISNAILRPFSNYILNILEKQADVKNGVFPSINEKNAETESIDPEGNITTKFDGKEYKSFSKYTDPSNEDLRYAVSVYADDITVSSNYPIDWNEAKRISGILRYSFEHLELPFKLNLKKTSIARNNGRKITGVRINHNDVMVVSRVKYMLLKSMCHRIKHGKKISMPKNVFQGNLAYARFVDHSGKIETLIAKYHANLVEFGINLKLPGELADSYVE